MGCTSDERCDRFAAGSGSSPAPSAVGLTAGGSARGVATPSSGTSRRRSPAVSVRYPVGRQACGAGWLPALGLHSTTARFGGPSRVRDTFAGMPSWYRDPTAPEPNVPRKIGVTALIERDGSFLVERRADDRRRVGLHRRHARGRRAASSMRSHREVLEETGFEIEMRDLLRHLLRSRRGSWRIRTEPSAGSRSVAFRVTPRGGR